MKLTTLLAVVLLAVAPPINGSELEIRIDPDSTSIAFTLGATMHSVHGSVKTTAGALRLDTGSGVMEGEVTVDATSAETGNKKRDRKMHTKVLLTDSHPWIVLHARRLEGELAPAGESNITFHGNMEILGQPHEVEIPLRVEINGGRFTASAEFEVPYVEWGLKDPSTFVLRVAKEVVVTVTAKGTVTIPAETQK